MVKIMTSSLFHWDTNWNQETPIGLNPSTRDTLHEGENEWLDFLQCLLASQILDVDVNTPIRRSLVQILLLYKKTGNLGFDTNLSRPNPLVRVANHSEP